jgi:hypothetical protein
MKCFLITFLLLAGISNLSTGQSIPLGKWQNHFSNLSARQVLEARGKIFYTTYNGLFSLDPTTKEIKSWSKSDGLNDNGISAFAFNPTQNLLLLAYRSGHIDFVFLDEKSLPEEVIAWPVLLETPGITTSKAVRKIVFQNNVAYLCTDFGVILLDTEVRQVKESYRYIGAGGSEVKVKDIAFSSDSIFAVTSEGMLATSVSPSVNRQYYANWKNIPSPGQPLTVYFFNEKLYAGFTQKGVYQRSVKSWQPVFSSSSPHLNINSSATDLIITAADQIITINRENKVSITKDPLFTALSATIQYDANYWVTDGKSGLLTNLGNDFDPVSAASIDTTISPRPDSIVTDLAGLTWTRIPDYLGGGILVKNGAGKQRTLSTSIGSGSLPSNTINSIALDYEGNMWFASDKGAGYFAPDDVLAGTRIDAILPIYGQRKLFSNEKCTAIAVEPGNRKWLATRNGLYHFIPDGTELLEMFNTDNSPLPSNEINALKFDAVQGLLFVDTPNGMVSYRSSASAASEKLDQITIFPNPVRPNYGGSVGFKGLTDQATVKITELSGRLIFETRAQGGTASWNLSDYNGKRARGGIYMIFIVSSDGTEKIAGKLAVIE